MQLPRPFDGFVDHTKRVSPTCLVHFERNRYSVPASYANRPVSLRVYADRIVVCAEGRLICEHPRIIERHHHGLGQTVYDWRHYLAVLQRKPGALRNGAPFEQLPIGFKRLQAALLKQLEGVEVTLERRANEQGHLYGAVSATDIAKALQAQGYNEAFSLHGSGMMFLVSVPVMEVMAIWLVPLMLGQRNMAFPRLNAFSFWMYLGGVLMIWLPHIANVTPDLGWFEYAPLSGPGYSPGHRADIWAQMITFTEVAALAASVNTFVTKKDPLTKSFVAEKSPLRIGCAIHPAMSAWIYIAKHPWVAVTDAKGSFVIKDVPPGMYTLWLKHPDSRVEDRKKIEVKAGKTTGVAVEWKDAKPKRDKK